MYEPYCTCCYSSFNPNYENQYGISNSVPIEPSIDSKKKPIRRSKHIPHHLRPQYIVERRNTRERRRVQDVNQAFLLLKALLPSETKNDDKDQSNSTRISKVRTLRKAVDYIEALQNMLNQTN
jgi:achaete-scute complex protein